MAVCARRGGARPLCDVETTLARGGKKQNGGGIVRYICVGWLCFKSQENLDQRLEGGLRALPEYHRYNHQIAWARMPPLSPPTTGSRSGLGFGSCGSETWGEKHKARV